IRGELTSRNPVIAGYRNILKLCHHCDIHNLTVPLLLLPDSHIPESATSPTSSAGSQLNLFSFTTTPSTNTDPGVVLNSYVQKRAELVLKSTKGVLMEQSRAAKHAGDSSGVEKEGRAIQFLLPSWAVFGGSGGVARSVSAEEAFGAVREKLADIFRTS
ncbi:hypothetical protein HDU76_010752, partial [Blyttiomyces sp. JEL0837]